MKEKMTHLLHIPGCYDNTYTNRQHLQYTELSHTITTLSGQFTRNLSHTLILFA